MNNKNNKKEKAESSHSLSFKLKTVIINIKKLLKKNVFFGIFLSLCFLIIAGLLTMVFMNSKELKSLNLKRDEAFSAYKNQEDILEKANNKLYSERLNGAFTDEQLIKMKNKYIKYALLINGSVVEGGTSQFNSITDKITVDFYERYQTDTKLLFPEELLNRLTKISQDEIEKRVKVFANAAEYTYSTQMYEDGRKVTMQFSNVLPGEIISLAIQSDFAKELGLNNDTSIDDETLVDNNLIEIFYNVSD